MDNEAKILQMLELLQQGQAEMKADISGLKDDVSGLKSDVSNLKSSFSKLNQTVARIEVDHGKKLSTLYDAHVDTVRNATTINALDAKVDNHDHRIFALEQKVSNG